MKRRSKNHGITDAYGGDLERGVDEDQVLADAIKTQILERLARDEPVEASSIAALSRYEQRLATRRQFLRLRALTREPSTG